MKRLLEHLNLTFAECKFAQFYFLASHLVPQTHCTSSSSLVAFQTVQERFPELQHPEYSVGALTSKQKNTAMQVRS